MKFNKWTLGLAAVGAVSMASAVRADEAPKLSQLNTALSSTTLSGYVDVAVQYNPGNINYKAANATPAAYGTVPALAGNANGIVDGFSMNDVDIALDKPEDDSPWASGYHVDINAGQDALFAISGSSVGVRQAYVTLRTPVGNGIDWKIGAFDGVTGYESNTGYSNPNYTRSYGWAANPASEVGVLGTYKVCNEVSVTAGVVNRDVPSVTDKDGGGGGLNGALGGLVGPGNVPLSSKSYVGMVALTAPDSWGWVKGSTLNLGTVQTFDGFGVNNYNVSLVMNTPVTGLTGGLAYDFVQTLGGNDKEDGSIYGVYATYHQTDKLSYNGRVEWLSFNQGPGNDDVSNFSKNGCEATATVEYDLWANVVSRAEVRWDHSDNGASLNSYSGVKDAFMVALNVVYKF